MGSSSFFKKYTQAAMALTGAGLVAMPLYAAEPDGASAGEAELDEVVVTAEAVPVDKSSFHAEGGEDVDAIAKLASAFDSPSPVNVQYSRRPIVFNPDGGPYDSGNAFFSFSADGDGWSAEMLYEVVDRDFGGLPLSEDFYAPNMEQAKTHAFTLSYEDVNKPEHFSYKGGILSPYDRRLAGAEYEPGLAGIYFGPNLSVQGGIIGSELAYQDTFNGGDILREGKAIWHVMAGTKRAGVSEFDDPMGPGFDDVIYGGGVDVSGRLSSLIFDAENKFGYNYTHFGAGPNGVGQDVHYTYLSSKFHAHHLSFQVLGEARETFLKGENGYEERQSHYAAIVQMIDRITPEFEWRVAGGVVNDTPAVEAYATLRMRGWAAQAGVAQVRDKLLGPQIMGQFILSCEF